jgi:hypothetical protein
MNLILSGYLDSCVGEWFHTHRPATKEAPCVIFPLIQGSLDRLCKVFSIGPELLCRLRGLLCLLEPRLRSLGSALLAGSVTSLLVFCTFAQLLQSLAFACEALQVLADGSPLPL